MTTTDPTPSTRNGVDTATLFATLDAVRESPEAARFQFRAHNRWVSGVHSQTTVVDYFGVGEERDHQRTFHFDADHPLPLVGTDQGPSPTEMVLVALASCLTAGIGNIAAARGVTLHEVGSTVVGDIDLNGVLGLDPEVRNGFGNIEVRFEIRGDAPAKTLEEIVEASRKRSAVFDIVTGSVPVSISTTTG